MEISDDEWKKRLRARKRITSQSETARKLPRIEDRKSVHISNIDRLTIFDPRGFGAVSDAEVIPLRAPTPEEYRILRKKGTEAAFSGEYYANKKKGIYHCAGCGQELFRSDDKYESGSGWPSFTRPIDKDHLEYSDDHKLLYPRTEVLCSNCHGHLGHVFDDGPPPTHQRYCINSIALKLEETS